MSAHDYALLDSGKGRKLERFGPVTVDRPCAQAVWRRQLPESIWSGAEASFSRKGGNHWALCPDLPLTWSVEIDGLAFALMPTDFGHMGVFPEHQHSWGWSGRCIREWQEHNGQVSGPRILNLFAYSGGATLAAARAGASVCHLDASPKMVSWARKNAELNHLQDAPIRWIVDDVHKFLAREKRRAARYEGIILDPPSFGRGTRQEVFKIDTDLREILALCRELLAEAPLFMLLTCHTPGYTPLVLQHLLTQAMNGCDGTITAGEMTLSGSQGVLAIPSGSFAGWCSMVSK